jgi:hypothetical protein
MNSRKQNCDDAKENVFHNMCAMEGASQNERREEMKIQIIEPRLIE